MATSKAFAAHQRVLRDVANRNDGAHGKHVVAAHDPGERQMMQIG
jgi:hypothetical protein